MANGTPSTSISLGAELLEQMGDLKGAAKELRNEAKEAKKDVTDATKEFKELEKQQKKNVREADKIRKGLDKMTGAEKADAERQIASLMDSSKVDAALSKVLDKKAKVDAKIQRSDILKDEAKEKQTQRRKILKAESDEKKIVDAKEKEKKEVEKGKALEAREKRKILQGLEKEKANQRRDVAKTIGKFDRGMSDKLFRAQDQLQGMAKDLASGGRLSQALGRQAGRLAGVAESVGGGISAVGGALAPLAPGLVAAGAGYGLAKAGAAIYNPYIQRQAEIGKRQGQMGDITRNMLVNMTGKQVSKEAASGLAEDQASRSARAKADLVRRSYFGDLDIGQVGKWLFGGATSREAEISKRELTLQTSENMLKSATAQFGKDFTKNLSLGSLEGSAGAQSAWVNFLRTEEGTKWAYMTEASKEKFKQEWAVKIQASTLEGERAKRENAVKKSIENPEFVAERHARATQFQGLERQRQRRQMQTASF